MIGIGVLGALAAATVGFLDFLGIPSRTAAYRTAVTHMVLNLVITAAYALDFGWRTGDSGPVDGGPLLLSAVSLLALGVSGGVGGKLATTTACASPPWRTRRKVSALSGAADGAQATGGDGRAGTLTGRTTAMQLAEQRIPSPAVVLHGIFAVTTVVLVLLAALDVGS